MSDDYFGAANRHLVDARVLYSATPASFAGASQLFGFAAECALKSMLQTKLGSVNIVRGHLQDFWREFESHSTLARRHAIRSQALMFKKHFDDWTVDQRYYKNSADCFNESILSKQEEAATQLVKLAHNIRKGLIR